MSHFYHQKIITPLGELFAVASKQAIVYLNFVDMCDKAKIAQYYPGSMREHSDLLTVLEQSVHAYFLGQKDAFSLAIDLQGTCFQKQCWQHLQSIPYGATSTYKQQALALNSPYAYRAVGRANGANPILLLVPCHRVVAVNNGLGGYSAGLWRKQWLLAHEKKFSDKS